MKISTIADLLEQEEDTPVIATRGRITTIYDAKEKPGDPAAKDYWKFQSLVMQDPDDEDQAIKVTLVKRETLRKDEWKGKLVLFESVKGKNGWTGLKIKTEKYVSKDTGEDVENKILWVTGTAEISLADKPERRQEEPPDDDDGDSGPVKSAPQPKTESPRKTAEQGDLLRSRQIVGRSGNLWGLGLRAVLFHISHIERADVRDAFLSNGVALNAAAATIMISAEKQGAALGMPSGNIYSETKRAPSDNDGGEA